VLRRLLRHPIARRLGGALTIAAALAALAAPAAAGHFYHGYRAPLASAHYAPPPYGYTRYAYPPYAYTPPLYAAAPYAHAAVVYRCAPCGHVFHSHASFYHHIHHYHHVALWEIPFLIVHTTIGWIFYG